MKLFYSDAYVASSLEFDTTRKAQWVADSLRERPIAGVELVAPAPLTEERLRAVHDAAYVESIRTGRPESLACSMGFPWDEGRWTSAAASNGGAVAAALAALREGVAGSLSSGLHHAARDRGRGFCTFNGLALAAREALQSGARRVLILDLDAHCGGGTRSLIREDERIAQVDVAVDGFDRYAPGPRASLDLVTDAREYLPTIERRLSEVEAGFDLCLYNAGMDPYEYCNTGGLNGVTREILAEREQRVFAWCRSRALPVAFVLAGGYVTPPLFERQELVELHRMTVAEAAGK